MAVGQVTSSPRCISEVRLFRCSLLLQCGRQGLGCLSGQSFHFQPLAPRDRSDHQPARVESHQAGSGEFRRPSLSLNPVFGGVGGREITSLEQGAQCVLHWAERKDVILFPQFMMGKRNVIADFLSSSIQVICLECPLNDHLFRDLQRR